MTRENNAVLVNNTTYLPTYLIGSIHYKRMLEGVYTVNQKWTNALLSRQSADPFVPSHRPYATQHRPYVVACGPV